MQIANSTDDETDELFVPICFHLADYANDKEVVEALIEHFGDEIKELSERMKAVVEKVAVFREHCGSHIYSRKEH